MASSLPIWTAIIIFGIVFLAAVGYLNPYVPKEEKKKAKKLSASRVDDNEENVIIYKTRINSIVYVIIDTVVVMIAAVSFVIEGFADFATHLGGGVLGNIFAVVLLIMGFFVVDVFFLAVMCVSEDVAEEDIKKYYRRHFGVEPVYEKEFNPSE